VLARRRAGPSKAACLLFLLTPATPAVGWLLGRAAGAPDLFTWYPLAFLFVAVPLLDLAVGADTRNPDDADVRLLAADLFYRLLPLLALPLQLACLGFGAWVLTAIPLAWSGMLAWVLSIGAVSGIMGINAAHELIHKNGRLEQWAGGLLLASVCYGGFKVEHVRGHHVDVGTPADNTTARLDQSAYRYIWRALTCNPVKAWRLEAERLRGLGLPAWHRRNEVLWWHACSLGLAAGFGLTFGWPGLALFFAQSAAAVALLELINYVEHYGLERRLLPDGQYEPVSRMHSWNSAYRLTNLFLLQLQRHPDHHLFARRPYQLLRHYPDSPQLRLSYAWMIWLALVPPLWRRVMNPRVADQTTRLGLRGARANSAS
jgi:alkane 1-monooxygenase